ncbi:MAG: ABC transporter substrate-binding protein [Caldimonas sp.]
MTCRRPFLSMIAAALLTGPTALQAQIPGRVYRLGILRPTGPAPFDVNIPEALRDRGYLEGQNIVIDRRYGEGRLERMPVFARELVAGKVDAIVAIGAVSVRAAMAATSTVPIVMFGNFDPVASGLVKSLARPGGNLTGVLIAPDGTLAGKKLELLLEVVPGATRVGMLSHYDPAVRQQVAELRKVASALGLSVHPVEVVDGDYERAFTALAAERPQMLFVAASTYFVRDRLQIIERAARYRMPAIYEWREHVQDGGLMAYATSLPALHKRVADYVDRIFEGAKAGDMPIEQPSKFELVINRKTAKALDLKLSPSLLLRAEVIE